LRISGWAWLLLGESLTQGNQPNETRSRGRQWGRWIAWPVKH